MTQRAWLLVALALLALLITPALALGDDVNPSSPTQVLTAEQFWALMIGGVSPLVGYVVNHYAPWVDEKAKAIAQVGLSALAGVIYTLAAAGDFALDAPHLQIVGCAVAGALLSHGLLWKPSGINTALGAGRNAGHAGT